MSQQQRVRGHLPISAASACLPVYSTCSDRPVAVSGSLQDYGYDDEEYEDWTRGPVNCSTTEAIKGGHVTYSQVKDVNVFFNTQFINWQILPSYSC